MSIVHISLNDIFGVAVACEVIFKPGETPFSEGPSLTVSGSRSIRLGADGTGSVTLKPGLYSVRFLGIPGNTDTLSITVPGDGLTYSLPALIDGGAGVVTPAPDYLRAVNNLSDVADPAAAFATISNATPAGRALLTAEDAAAQRTLLGVGASHSVPNRFAADHSGWHLGDLVRQAGDSVPESVTITINSDLPDDGSYYYVAGDFYDVDPDNYGWFLDGWSGPLSAGDVAANIAADINAQVDFVTATASGAVVTVVANNAGELSSAWSFYDPGYDQALDFTAAVVQSGAFGVPPGDFIVVDTDHLGDASGYQSIGTTADFLNGYGAPTSAIGEEGNGYVDLYNGDFYHRDASGWVFVLNITGPQGATGAAGAAGVAGLTAAQLKRVGLQQWGTVGLAATVFSLDAAVAQSVTDGEHLWILLTSAALVKMDLATGTVVDTYPTGVSAPSNLFFNGANLWVSDATAGTLTKIDPGDGSVVGTYTTTYAGAMTFDGVNIWTVDYATGHLVKVLASTGAVVATYALGDINAPSLIFDGTNVWVAINSTLKKINPANGSVLLTTGSITGAWNLTFDGNYIWAGKWLGVATNALTKVRPSDGAIIASYSPNNNAVGVTFDGVNIWVTCNDGATAGKITQVRASDGAVIRSRTPGLRSYQLLFDGVGGVWVWGPDSKISKLTI